MRSFKVLVVGLVLGVSFAHAQVFMPSPELTGLAPLGAQAGTSVDVSVAGLNLDGASALVFADATITSAVKSSAADKAEFTVKIPANIKPGSYDAFVRGKYGLSNPRRFCIGSLPESTPPNTMTSQEKAAVISMNSVVNGVTNVGQRSWFKFHATAKQRAFIRVESPDTRLEAQLTLSDTAGRVVQRVSGNETLDFIAPAEGDFFIELHDLLYRGGADSRYRLVLSAQPLPAARSEVMASGFMEETELQRINSLAMKAGDAVPRDLALTPPCEHISLFPQGGRSATFTFAAKKGDVYWIDVLSHRLGHSTDAALVIEKIEKQADGSMKPVFIAEAPDMDFTGTATGFDLNMRDGVQRIEAKEDGTYRVILRDLFNTAPKSPRLPYRLSIRKETPDFQLVAVPDQPVRAAVPVTVFMMPPNLRRGGISSVRVFVQRQDGFAGDIVLKAEGLPADVTCLGAVLGNGDECASLTFQAADNAAPWAGLVRIVGTAKIDGKDVTRTARYGSSVWTMTDTRKSVSTARLIDGIGLAVVEEEAPVLIELEKEGVIELKPTDKLPLKLKVTRRGDYNEALKVRAFVLGDHAKSVAALLDIPAKATTATLEIDLSKYGVKPGEHTFVLMGNADRVKYKPSPEPAPADAAKDKEKATPKKDAAAAKPAAPKDMTYVVFSKPIHIKITEPPKK
jgi:hypothetical protein